MHPKQLTEPMLVICPVLDAQYISERIDPLHTLTEADGLDAEESQRGGLVITKGVPSHEVQRCIAYEWQRTVVVACGPVDQLDARLREHANVMVVEKLSDMMSPVPQRGPVSGAAAQAGSVIIGGLDGLAPRG